MGWTPARLYGRLLDLNFRRSARHVYRPACPGCGACRQLRIPVRGFRASRSQRRVMQRNEDVVVEVGVPRLDDEKWELYRSYLDGRHDGAMARGRDALGEFLYSGGVDPMEASYRVLGRLVAVSLLDLVPGGWSSVYSFFDPQEARRSLGTLTVLLEIEAARSSGASWYYLGFHVEGARTMEYKARFLPHERLGPDGSWQTFVRPGGRGQ